MDGKVRPARLETSDLNGELAVYDPREDSVHILNSTARIVYEMAAAGRTPGEIEAALREKFDSGPDSDVAGDVRRLIDEMKEKGWLGT